MKKLRLEQAQHLLRDTPLPITQIAGEVGFTDYTYFCRVFKREVGLSAHQYRKIFDGKRDAATEEKAD